jgi:hypothetical protein
MPEYWLIQLVLNHGLLLFNVWDIICKNGKETREDVIMIQSSNSYRLILTKQKFYL